MEPLRKALLAGLGVLGAGKDRVQSVVENLVEKGELTREQGESVLQGWVERGKEEQESAQTKIADEIQKVMGKLNLVTREELDAVIARVEALEKPGGES